MLLRTPHLTCSITTSVSGSEKKNVEDILLCNAFDLVDQTRAELSLSYFEFGTLAAMQIFSTLPLDVVVFEVGLGGRLDAVNIYDADVAIVSNIGLDHLQWLGSTRESIGLEKSGIFRKGKPVICGDTEPPESLLKYAGDIGSELYLVDEDFSYRQERVDSGHSTPRSSTGVTCRCRTCMAMCRLAMQRLH